MRYRSVVTISVGGLLVSSLASAQTFTSSRPNVWATPSAPMAPARAEAPPLDQNSADTIATELRQRKNSAGKVAADLKQEDASAKLVAHALRVAGYSNKEIGDAMHETYDLSNPDELASTLRDAGFDTVRVVGVLEDTQQPSAAELCDALIKAGYKLVEIARALQASKLDLGEVAAAFRKQGQDAESVAKAFKGAGYGASQTASSLKSAGAPPSEIAAALRQRASSRVRS
jgi:hypothetical protein